MHGGGVHKIQGPKMYVVQQEGGSKRFDLLCIHNIWMDLKLNNSETIHTSQMVL